MTAHTTPEWRMEDPPYGDTIHTSSRGRMDTHPHVLWGALATRPLGGASHTSSGGRTKGPSRTLQGEPLRDPPLRVARSLLPPTKTGNLSTYAHSLKRGRFPAPHLEPSHHATGRVYHDDPWDDEGHPLAGGTETHRSVELDHRNDAGTLWHYRAALIQSSAPSALLKIGEAVSTPGV